LASAAIDGRLARLAGFAEVAINSDVRRDRPIPEFIHELRDVIALIRTERDPPSSARAAVDQVQRRLTLGGAGGLADTAANR